MVKGDYTFTIQKRDQLQILEVFYKRKFVCNHICTTLSEVHEYIDSYAETPTARDVPPNFGSYHEAVLILCAIREQALDYDDHIVSERVRCLDACIRELKTACDREVKVFEDAQAEGNAVRQAERDDWPTH